MIKQIFKLNNDNYFIIPGDSRIFLFDVVDDIFIFANASTPHQWDPVTDDEYDTLSNMFRIAEQNPDTIITYVEDYKRMINNQIIKNVLRTNKIVKILGSK